MTDRDMSIVQDCLEATRYYAIMAERHRAFSRGVRACTGIERANDVISEAYLMRSETLTKERA